MSMNPWLLLAVLATAGGCQSVAIAPVSDRRADERAATSHAVPTYSSSSIRSAARTGASVPLTTDEINNRLNRYYLSWRGVPHNYGGESFTGVDCSGFVKLAYREIFGVQLPRTVSEQSRIGSRVSKRNLQAGDLVFFKTGWRRRHVGVYVGDNQFIHASERHGVTRSSMNNKYWRRRYWKSKRLN